MRHATPETLDAIEPLLEGIRKAPGLRERRRGIFYRRAVAYLHFHEDPAGLFADVKLGGRWKRLNVTSPASRRDLLRSVRQDLTD